MRGSIRAATCLLAVTFFSARQSSCQEIPARVFEYTARIVIDGNGQAYQSAVPVPIEWPEQKVEVVASTVKRGKSRVENYGDGGAMLLLVGEAVPKGEQAEVEQRYRVTVSPTRCSKGREDFPSVARVKDRKLQAYLKPSPGIESRDEAIKALAEDFVKSATCDWDRARLAFDWVHREIEYREMDFTGASAALKFRVGDCEEKASLFIACCRAMGIPARTVLVPGHCWAEFYLVDHEGQGHWIPAHTSGSPWFGSILQPQVVLQKGDSFVIPQRKQKATRILSPWLRGPTPEPSWEHSYLAKEIPGEGSPS